jgi:hypothetical protein
MASRTLIAIVAGLLLAIVVFIVGAYVLQPIPVH